MAEPFIGQVAVFAFNFAPRYWAFCNGATLGIAQNSALFSVIGTTYGGDGRTTFCLPNIQDSCVMGWGHGPGLSDYALGQTSGVTDVTLQISQMPSHSHTVSAIGASQPTDFVLTPAPSDWIGSRQSSTGRQFLFGLTPTAADTFNPQVIMPSGSSMPHVNEQPYLCMNYCIAVEGMFPSRN